MSPWSNDYVFTKYTAEGTALDAYTKVARNRQVDNAIQGYERDMAEEAENKVARELSAKGTDIGI